MNNSYKKIVSSFLLISFTYAIFCCSICNLTTPFAKTSHSCCHANNKCSDEKICKKNNFFLASLSEKLTGLEKNTAVNFSKIIFCFNISASDFLNFKLAKNFYRSLPKLLQKSVPIYLSDQALRL